MATTAEQLILRGLHIMMRASFSPNSPEAQAKHFMGLQADIGPWMTDYAEEIAKPAALTERQLALAGEYVKEGLSMDEAISRARGV